MPSQPSCDRCDAEIDCTLPYALLLEPAYMSRPWAGRRIAARFRRHVPIEQCGEAWEVAARADGAARILNGPQSGIRLDAFWKSLHEDTRPFPLLVKLIDAGEKLSVQVHPDDVGARLHGGEAKTEMWYVLDAAPDACIYAGLKPGTNADTLLRALDKGDAVTQLLNVLPIRAGQAVFIPGGCVHAIGGGCLMYEVQQNSNTTYRLYDWNRRDRQGSPRELHIEQALAVMHEDLPTPRLLDATLSTPKANFVPLIECDAFRFGRHRLDASGMAAPIEQAVGVVLFSEHNAVRVRFGDHSLDVPEGCSALLPNGIGPCRLLARDTSAVVLITAFPWETPPG